MTIFCSACQAEIGGSIVIERQGHRGEWVARQTISGTAAAALPKLIAAGRHGVHATEIAKDAPARLEQAGIKIEAFAAETRGTGARLVWLRLYEHQPPVRIVEVHDEVRA